MKPSRSGTGQHYQKAQEDHSFRPRGDRGLPNVCVVEPSSLRRVDLVHSAITLSQGSANPRTKTLAKMVLWTTFRSITVVRSEKQCCDWSYPNRMPNCGIHSSCPWTNTQAMLCLNQENAMLFLEAGNMDADQAIAAYCTCYLSQQST